MARSTDEMTSHLALTPTLTAQAGHLYKINFGSQRMEGREAAHAKCGF
jgi:hypothetical protein